MSYLQKTALETILNAAEPAINDMGPRRKLPLRRFVRFATKQAKPSKSLTLPPARKAFFGLVRRMSASSLSPVATRRRPRRCPKTN